MNFNVFLKKCENFKNRKEKSSSFAKYIISSYNSGAHNFDHKV